MILAAAQTQPKRGDIEANLADHYRLINLASDNGADLIAFPEMSITGYERENASKLAFSPDDSRIERLKELASNKQIIVIAGAPIKINNDLFIGAYIIHPNGEVSIYTKHYLHTGEEIAFKPSLAYNPVLELNGEKISFAICADIMNPEHAENAGTENTTLYVAGIFFSPQGIAGAHKVLSGYAKKYSMNVLMSNFGGSSYGSPSAGKSAFWNKEGELINCLENKNTELLLIERKGSNWIKKTITELQCSE